MTEFNNGRREVVNRVTRFTQVYDVKSANFNFRVRVFKEVAGQSTSDSTSASESYIELIADDGTKIKYTKVGDTISMDIAIDGNSAKQLNEEFKDLQISKDPEISVDFWEELQTGSFEKALQLLSL